MGLLDFIERLREQPVSERRRWALSSAIGGTLFVALIWLSFLVIGFSNTADELATQDSASATNTPFETIVGGIGEAWGGVERAIKAFGSVEYVPKENKSSGSSNL